MSGLDAAADGLVAAIEQFRPLIVVADALKTMGSLDNAIAERQKAYQTAVARDADMKLQIEATNTQLRDLKAQQVASIQQTKDTIQSLTAEGVQQRVDLLAKAQTQASDLIAAAGADVAKQQQDSFAVLAENQAIVTALQQQTTDGKAALAALQQQIIDAQATLDAIKAQVQTTLATMKTLAP